jgi:Carbohydrate family 9 binding domain-like
MIRRTIFLFAVALATSVYAANWPEHPILHAVRVSVAPAIDGDLSDPAWQNAPEFTDFTQHDPDDGKPATLRTSIRIVYDDRAIYFGAKMSDSGRPTALPARRDTFNQSDFLSINLDPQLDRLSGNAFTISPANGQVDTVLYNDIGEDSSWDGVWESATKIVRDGWIAEVRIPFS